MENTQTIGEATDAYTTQFGFTNTGSDRIWFHDLCHVLTGELGSEQIITGNGNNVKDWGLQPTNRSEILAAVYQAVLLNEREVKPKQIELCDGADAPAFRTVVHKIVPKAMAFLKRGNVDISQQVSEDEMNFHFQVANKLGRALERRFGEKIGDVSREEIAKIPMHEIQEIVEYAKSNAITFGFENPR